MSDSFSNFVQGLKDCNWYLWARLFGGVAVILLLLSGFFNLLQAPPFAVWSIICGLVVLVGECHAICPCSGGAKLAPVCKLLDRYWFRSSLYTVIFILGVVFYVFVNDVVFILIAFILLEVSSICYAVSALRKEKEPDSANGKGQNSAGADEAPVALPNGAKSSFAGAFFSAAKDNPELTKAAAGAAYDYAKENPDQAKEIAGAAYSYGQQNPDWAKGVAAQQASAYGAPKDDNPFAV